MLTEDKDVQQVPVCQPSGVEDTSTLSLHVPGGPCKGAREPEVVCDAVLDVESQAEVPSSHTSLEPEVVCDSVADVARSQLCATPPDCEPAGEPVHESCSQIALSGTTTPSTCAGAVKIEDGIQSCSTVAGAVGDESGFTCRPFHLPFTSSVFALVQHLCFLDTFSQLCVVATLLACIHVSASLLPTAHVTLALVEGPCAKLWQSWVSMSMPLSPWLCTCCKMVRIEDQIVSSVTKFDSVCCLLPAACPEMRNMMHDCGRCVECTSTRDVPSRCTTRALLQERVPHETVRKKWHA